MKASRALSRTLPGGSVRLRPSVSSLALSLVTAIFPLVPFGLAVHDGSEPFLSWLWLTLTVVDVTVIALAVTRRRVILHWDRLEHRNLWRSRSIPAAQIQAVTVGEGSLVRPVQVWTADRRSHTMPALTEADVSVIGDWWLERRGSDWRPAWNPQAPAPTAATWWA